MTRRTFTLERFLRIPEQKPALEYNPDGTIQQKMPPTTTHALLQASLAHLLTAYARPRRLGWVLTELRTKLGGASRVPDIAFYRERPHEELPTKSPTMAIEILSPGDTLMGLEDKCAWYVEQGTELVLLVNPRERARSIEVVTAEGRQVLQGEQELPLGGVLPGLHLTVGQVFADALEDDD